MFREEVLQKSGLRKEDVTSSKENADLILSGLELLSNQPPKDSMPLSPRQLNPPSMLSPRAQQSPAPEKPKKKSDIPPHALLSHEDPLKVSLTHAIVTKLIQRFLVS